MNPITMKLVVDDLILQALREDITFEDVSTASVCPTARPATVELIAKADGIIAGLDVFARTFELLDSQSSVLIDVADGDEVHKRELAQALGISETFRYADIKKRHKTVFDTFVQSDDKGHFWLRPEFLILERG